MSSLRMSVVVASRDRPGHLANCLGALAQVHWPDLEVIVVADDAGRAVADSAGVEKVVPQAAPNLAAARNAGIAAAGGDVIAFIDDDAVPEPMWLAALAAEFARGQVGAATGPVLGRNGITVQSGAFVVRTDAVSMPVDADAFKAPKAFSAPKTVGTNMAFRADLLRAVGGFDETFGFYLDDADLNIRLGRLGVRTAFAPLAVVHHAMAPSARRLADRRPLDLFDIGRSTAAFIARHYHGDRDSAIAAARSGELARTLRCLQQGLLEPRDVGRLLDGFDRGVGEGREDVRERLADFGQPEVFRPLARQSKRHAVVAAATPNRARALVEARRLRNNGLVVSLFLFTPTTLYHRVRYAENMWIQTGGVWGRSVRDAPMVRFCTRKSRLDEEIARVSDVRGWTGAAAALLPEGHVTEPDLFHLS